MEQVTVKYALNDAGTTEAATLSIFEPEDLTCMRHAVRQACINAAVQIDSESCFEIARKIISSYRPGLTEQELVAAVSAVK